MSDIAIDIPFPVIAMIYGAIYWPLTLCVGAVGLYVGVTRLRGVWRVVCVVIALLFIGDAGAGIYESVRQGLNT
ncbi:MAG: hypothetical protein ACN6QT_24145 [Burkholderia contaminans]|uniref:Uncharacterized protein n=1 Tax=Burkholderia contaminans TaxID=488447 RepID=A0AAP4VFU1_9BURK|nr:MULTISPECIES: hypothetical protein [Burkholderia]MBD1410898.1 hypothetical protein [Burkholderia contaminans]MBH9667265.1 hypothetical protein [Burkholderia contaminans]MBH9673186.1 hypothetical protein [Burkholderia contaminans]MBH9703229.1 hypothetical protein [Burkholderia contaminans]MBH9721418.1 hypothetical protein [Burkholderia contaminans]